MLDPFWCWLWPRIRRYALLLALDAVVILSSFYVAFLLRFDGRIPRYYMDNLTVGSLLIVAIFLALNVYFGVHRTIWKYGGLQDALALGQATLFSTLLLGVADVFLFPVQHPIPVSAIPTGGLIVFLALGILRLMPRWKARLVSQSPSAGASRVLIIGCGNAGQLLARELLQNRPWPYRLIGFVDDDPSKLGMKLHRMPILGTRKDIPAIVAEQGIDLIAIAIPSAPSSVIRELVSICQETPAKIRIVPGVPELMSSNDYSTLLREVTLDDLLGREPAEIDFSLCSEYVKDKVILVTGAAGSIGSELCRQLSALGPALLLAVDNNESALFDLNLELLSLCKETAVKACIGDVRHEDKLEELFSKYTPQAVFHAAAYKHVPLMEEHPDEAVQTNVVGTLNLCAAADRHGAERFVFISTDKAVNPSSVMGASKRLGEMLVSSFGNESKTIFCAVRFGNVIGSRGSVVPTFLRQIESGGPVTVTHPEVSRFFMTIPEAASLVVQAAAFAKPGAIFMLDMGEEIKIAELAEKMIRLKGLRVGRDVEIDYTGLRPGEKLHEELVGPGESLLRTAHAKLFLVDSGCVVEKQAILSAVEVLNDTAQKRAYDEIPSLLSEIVEQGLPGMVSDKSWKFPALTSLEQERLRRQRSGPVR